MSGNEEYDNQNDDSQNYGDGEDQDQEYDSQDENSQNNGDNDDGDDGGNDDNDCNDDQDDDDDDDDENSDGPKYIRLRGLPWSATHKEILDFLKGINVVGGAEGIHIVTRRWDGVNTGEAYVELKGPQDAAAAMKLDNATMGHRYIEVFSATAREAKDAMRKSSNHGTSYVVKLRGLPYSITEKQVEQFFKGLEIKPDREGLVFVTDRRGRPTGEAFVQFESQEDTEQALGRNRQKILHRYIEIFRSSLAELKRATSGNGRMAPYDLKDRGGNRGSNGSDYGGNNRNNRWGGNGGFGVGANNTLGFNNLPSFGNSGNFGKNNGSNFGNFGNNGGGGGGGMGNFGNFGGNNNGGGNFGNFGNNNGGNNFGNNSGGGNMGGGGGGGGGFNRFSGNSGNFGNDFGDFGNFGNNRGNNSMGGGNNMGSGGGFNNNFSNFGNGGGNNMGGGGGGFGNNMGGGGFGNGGGNYGPIGGGRNEEFFMIMMRGLPFSSFENDVYKFFEPLRPVNVRIHYNKQNGRHNGTAEALFDNYEDAQKAMKRQRSKMGQRYIELFLNEKPHSGKSGSNNYPSDGNMSGIGNNIGSGNNSISSGGGGGGMGGGMGSGNMFLRRI